MTAMKKGYSRMKKGGLTTNRIYLIVAVAVLILGVGAVFGHIYYNGKTTGIENSSITTGAQNIRLFPWFHFLILRLPGSPSPAMIPPHVRHPAQDSHLPSRRRPAPLAAVVCPDRKSVV